MSAYLVFFRYDDRRQTPGRCRTDHALSAGEMIYAKHGRAIVTCCREDLATDDTSRRNARALRVLAGPLPANS